METRTFQNLYQAVRNEPSPAAKFVHDIAILTNRSETTVRKWIAGETTPDIKVQVVLQRHFNIPMSELFPIDA